MWPYSALGVRTVEIVSKALTSRSRRFTTIGGAPGAGTTSSTVPRAVWRTA